MNKNNYWELLCGHPGDCFGRRQADCFLQDGVPCHTATGVNQWPRDCDVAFFDDWPGNSPHLSPMDNLWALAKRKLRGKDTPSLPKLAAATRDVWHNFKPELLHSVGESVPPRVRECLKGRGRPRKCYKLVSVRFWCFV